MIKIYKNSIQQPKMKRVEDYARFSWIRVIAPTESELKDLGKRLNLSEDTLSDSIDQHEMPILKKENGNVVIIIRAGVPSKGGSSYKTVPITIVVSDKYVTTITREETNVLQDIASGKVPVVTTQRSKFLISVLLSITYYYQKYITNINRVVQGKKKNIRYIKSRDVFTLIQNEEILNDFVGSLVPNINVIHKLLTYKQIDLYQADKDLIDDLSVDAEQVLAVCNTNLKTVNSIREGYATVLSTRLNQGIKALTFMTAFFTIPTMVANIYGMNIILPLADRPEAFWILTGISITTMAMLLSGYFFYTHRQ